MEQELPTIPEHQSSLPVFSEVRVTRYSVLCVCFKDRCLAIVLSVLRFTDSDYPLISSTSSYNKAVHLDYVKVTIIHML